MPPRPISRSMTNSPRSTACRCCATCRQLVMGSRSASAALALGDWLGGCPVGMGLGGAFPVGVSAAPNGGVPGPERTATAALDLFRDLLRCQIARLFRCQFPREFRGQLRRELRREFRRELRGSSQYQRGPPFRGQLRRVLARPPRPAQRC